MHSMCFRITAEDWSGNLTW